MTTVEKYYSGTVFLTSNIEEVKTKVQELLINNLDSSGKFSDPEFGPTPSDPKGETSIFFPPDELNELQGDPEVGAFNNIAGLEIDMIQWLRPRDFCTDPVNCHFMTRAEEEEKTPLTSPKELLSKHIERDLTKRLRKGGASSLDVMQGNLGDCWFISALALVAIRDDLLHRVLCDEQFIEYEDKGLYVFRMYKNCRVYYVVVDDKVPCLEKSDGQNFPAFARCRNPNEYWVSLVEKAYAKLNIRYINLTSGFIDEALQDLTGLAPGMLKFDSDTDQDSFWEVFKLLSYSNSLIGASLNFQGRKEISDRDKRKLQMEAGQMGIQYGHAYGVLDVREVPDEENPEIIHRLLRVKNPWGSENQFEWTGDWSDDDPKWTEAMKKRYNEVGRMISNKVDKNELDHKFAKNDNIFVMKFDDFVYYFNTLMAVRDFPEEWSGVRYYTKWDPCYGIPPRGKNWTKNPQFPFYLNKSAELAVNLQQPDPRAVSENRHFNKYTILVVVFKLDQRETKVTSFDPKKIAMQSLGANSRCVTANGNLSPGKYSIILLNSLDGCVSECYCSIYFDCPKEDIIFEKENWEVILEEEEEAPRLVPSKSVIAKHALEGVISNFSKKGNFKNHFVKSTLITGNLNKVVKTKNEFKNSITKSVAFGKTIYKKIGNLASKEIQKDSVEPEQEETVQDSLIEEVKFENQMALLLGIKYSEYKNFFKLSKDKQEQVASSYQCLSKRVETTLDLSYYCLGNRGLLAVVPQIEDFSELRYLLLRGNQLANTSVCEMFRRLELSRQYSLLELDLSDNPELDDITGTAAITLISRIQSIQQVYLEDTGVSTKLKQAIQNTLNKRSSLNKKL